MQKVSWVVKAFGQGLADCHNMWQDIGKEEVGHLYSTMVPTSKVMLGLLKVDETTLPIGQKTVLCYMKRFIRNADESTLAYAL